MKEVSSFKERFSPMLPNIVARYVSTTDDHNIVDSASISLYFHDVHEGNQFCSSSILTQPVVHSNVDVTLCALNTDVEMI